MSTHTPGHWHFYPLLSGSENHKGYRIQDKAGWIGDCSPRDEDGKEGEANARLIAAAPDLLAALQTIANLADAPHWNTERKYTIRQLSKEAIAKATQP